MNTNKLRTYICTAMMICLVVVAGKFTYAFSNITQEKNQDVLQAIDDAADHAAAQQKNVHGLRMAKEENEKLLKKAQRKLDRLGKEKREMRRRMARKLKRASEYEEKYGVDPTNEEELESFLDEQRKELLSFVEGYVRFQQFVASADDDISDVLVPKLTGVSLGDQVENGLRQRALSRARMRLMKDMTAMSILTKNLTALREDYGTLGVEYDEALAVYEEAKSKVMATEAALEEIKQIQAAVDAEIAAMQTRLAEYDNEIRESAEQDLIAKGLRSKSASTTGTPKFIWPVSGRLTADYFNREYQAYFGVPHKAIDIAKTQGSDVRAAAEGIVHRVKDGGQYGYSYILIGHRGGYATLYGHLSQMHVVAGQHVTQGETIGLSGGAPGTHGAGPMTTGSHLHFEVIKDGVHMNPESVLP